MKLVNAADMEGAALDWAVAKCEGIEVHNASGLYVYTHMDDDGFQCAYSPSSRWEHGGPIIEREGLCLTYDPFVKRWACATPILDSCMAEKPLVAAMRCYVASKLGDEIELPDTLLAKNTEVLV